MVLYPPRLRRPVTLVSPRDEYRVGDMAPLYAAAASSAADAGARMALGTRYAGRRDGTFLLLVGAEEVLEVPRGREPPAFHCVLDPSLAPGYRLFELERGA